MENQPDNPLKTPSPDKPRNTPKTAFGRVIQYYRTQLDISQEEMSKSCALGRNAINEYENGKRKKPNRGTIAKVVGGLNALGLEITIEEFDAKVIELHLPNGDCLINETAVANNELHFQDISVPAQTNTQKPSPQLSNSRADELKELSRQLRQELGQISQPSNILTEEAQEDLLGDLEDLIEIAVHSPEALGEDDILSLVLFQQTLLSLYGDSGDSGLRVILDHGAFARMIELLADLLSGYPVYPSSRVSTHDNVIAPIFRELKEQVEQQTRNEAIPDKAQRSLKNMHSLVKGSDRSGELRLDMLDSCTKRLRVHRIGAFHRIEGLVSYLIGRRLDLAPPLCIFRDLDEDWCPEMVIIPSGKFLMGSADDEGDDDEHPQHEVTIDYRFAVGRYPVTFEEWDFYVSRNPKAHNPDDKGWGRERRPVIEVSWDDTRGYLEWLEKQTGQPYRLLSEAEWEYACRAGTDTEYSFGDTITREQAQYSENEYGEAKQTVPVGSFEPNQFGLYDMHGNVWEWCEDHWHENYEGAPSDGSAWVEDDDENTTERVLRGGSWYIDPRDRRARYRSRINRVSRDWSVGFRVARALAFR